MKLNSLEAMVICRNHYLDSRFNYHLPEWAVLLTHVTRTGGHEEGERDLMTSRAIVLLSTYFKVANSSQLSKGREQGWMNKQKQISHCDQTSHCGRGKKVKKEKRNSYVPIETSDVSRLARKNRPRHHRNASSLVCRSRRLIWVVLWGTGGPGDLGLLRPTLWRWHQPLWGWAEFDSMCGAAGQHTWAQLRHCRRGEMEGLLNPILAFIIPEPGTD